MAIKNLAKTIKNAVIAGVAFALISFFANLVPCRTYTKTSSSLGLCAIQSPFTDITDASTKFYGFSNNPILPIVIQFAAGALVYLLIASLIKRKKSSKVLDLTRR